MHPVTERDDDGSISSRRLWAAEVGKQLSVIADDQARMIRLVYIDRLSSGDAAQRMGVSVHAARDLLAHGLRLLGESLRQPA